MVHRMSRTLLKTLRDAPADAETRSHRLLVRAGHARRTDGGGWAWLPLGTRVLENVTRVVREELEAAGSQEVVLPVPGPDGAPGTAGPGADPRSRVPGRRGAGHLPGPADEAAFARVVRDLAASYKDLPVTLHQVRTAHHDEAGTRGGPLRARETRVAAACSFGTGDEDPAAAHRLHRDTCVRALTRLGLDHRIVRGTPAGREEILAPAAAGEETWAHCPACGYAATAAAVTTRPAPAAATGHPPLETLDTPGTPTIGTLAAHLAVPASAILKNLLVTVDGEITGVGVPGDREVDLGRLRAALAPAAVDLVTAADFEGRPDLVRGYVGPQGRTFRYLADPRIGAGTAWITGANAPGRHARNVVAGRDFTVDRYLDVVAVRPGDPCPECGAGLETAPAIHVGHLALPGPDDADAFPAEVLGRQGRPVRVRRSSWALDLTRVLVALAEQTADGQGLCWPREAAPADVHLVAAGKAAQTEAALEIAGKLHAAGLRVLVDDRAGVSPGVKFTDAELIGVPQVVVVGRRIAEGIVELKDRRTGEREELTVDRLMARLTC